MLEHVPQLMELPVIGQVLGFPVQVTPLAGRNKVYFVKGRVLCDLIGFWHLCDLDDTRRGAPRWDEGWE